MISTDSLPVAFFVVGIGLVVSGLTVLQSLGLALVGGLLVFVSVVMWAIEKLR